MFSVHLSIIVSGLRYSTYNQSYADAHKHPSRYREQFTLCHLVDAFYTKQFTIYKLLKIPSGRTWDYGSPDLVQCTKTDKMQ